MLALKLQGLKTLLLDMMLSTCAILDRLEKTKYMFYVTSKMNITKINTRVPWQESFKTGDALILLIFYSESLKLTLNFSLCF